jgi:superfamily II DNA or RNA helicase
VLVTDAGALPIPSPPETNRWNAPDDRPPEDPAIAELPLRPWQREALAQLEASAESSFLAVATPGAGKTVFALWAVLRALRQGLARRLIVVVPTQHLKRQWAQAAEALHIHLDPEWSAGYGGLPSDVHGVAVTYQQVAANPAAMRALVRGAMVVLDEVHHAGESRAWGDAVRLAFEPAARRLCLSGTPFRSDQRTIPFVRYEGDLAQAQYEYGYGQALEESCVVRPVYFPRINGHMEWTAPDGSDYNATFDDRLTKDLGNQRLRAALDTAGEWLPAVLGQAHAQLGHLRQRDPRAGGLVIAIDQEHARGIAQIMYDTFGVSPTVATSDDPDASRKISAFAEGNAPWLVAVRMVSEGVDIPRLRVGVYATNTVTELFFRQAVGRLVRWRGGLGRQAAYMFIPDDPRLRTFAGAIAEQRRHNLRKLDDERRPDEEEGAAPPAVREPAMEEQLSLFSVISAVPLDEHGRPLDAGRIYEDESTAGEDPIPEWASGGAAGGSPPGHLDGPGAPAAAFIPTLPPPLPEPAEPGAPRPDPAKAKSPLARRRELREANSEVVRELVHDTGKSHAELNAELNRKAGIRRVSEATIKQLEQRLEFARKLLKR